MEFTFNDLKCVWQNYNSSVNAPSPSAWYCTEERSWIQGCHQAVCSNALYNRINCSGLAKKSADKG